MEREPQSRFTMGDAQRLVEQPARCPDCRTKLRAIAHTAEVLREGSYRQRIAGEELMARELAVSDREEAVEALAGAIEVQERAASFRLSVGNLFISLGMVLAVVSLLALR